MSHLSVLRNDPTTARVWSPLRRRDVYVTPRQLAFLTWLRADGWRLTTNRRMAAMFSVSPGTVAQWLRVLVSLGLVAMLSRRGRLGWTRVRRNAGATVSSRGSHAPVDVVQEPPTTALSSSPSLSSEQPVRALPDGPLAGILAGLAFGR